MTRAAILLVLLTLTVPVAAHAEDMPLSVEPQHIEIGAFYNGLTLAVRGAAPGGTQVLIRFTGTPEAVHLKQKGKALGLLWMNMNSLEFEHVPTVCLIDTSAPLADFGQAGQALSLEGLAKGFAVEPADADRASLVPEFLRLKEQDGLFRQQSGAVTLGQEQDGARAYSLNMAIPSRLSPGAYTLEAFAIKDGQVVAQSAIPMEVTLVGVPAFIANLAFNHGLWFGILASVIAILAGLGIGMVFQSKEPH